MKPTDTLPHVSLDTEDLERSIAFHRALLDRAPFLRRHDYARFVARAPGLVLGLNGGRPVVPGGALQHLGVAYREAADLERARQRLESAHIPFEEEADVVCCYGRLTRLWATDPASGVRWELFVPLAEQVEAPTRAARPGAACCPAQDVARE